MDIYNPIHEEDTESVLRNEATKQLNFYKKLLSLRIKLQQVMNQLHSLPIPPLNLNSLQLNDIPEKSLTTSSTQLFGMFAELATLVSSSISLPPNITEDDEIIIQKDSVWEKRKIEWEENCTPKELNDWTRIDKPLNRIKRSCLEDLDNLKVATQLKKTEIFQVIDQRPSLQIINSMKDEKKWIERSHPEKDTSEIIGLRKNDQTDPSISRYMQILSESIYTDDDFYATLLKESFQHQSPLEDKNTLNNNRTNKNPTGNRHTSKGRKLYTKPIPELQNFMAARPNPLHSLNDALNGQIEESNFIDQLMRSLLKND